MYRQDMDLNKKAIIITWNNLTQRWSLVAAKQLLKPSSF
jgi:hypothetical protein